MDKFEEWWKTNGAKYDYVLPASRDSFKAGQQSRQSEVDQLKHEKSLQELEINQVAQANQEWQRLVDEKDKRIAHLVKRLNELVGLTVDDLEETLRGKDQYTEHRTKAEEQINKGARLTKHQIDLGDNNANS